MTAYNDVVVIEQRR